MAFRILHTRRCTHPTSTRCRQMSQAIAHGIRRLPVAAENEQLVAKAARASRAAPRLPTHESSALTQPLHVVGECHRSFPVTFTDFVCEIEGKHADFVCEIEERHAKFMWHSGRTGGTRHHTSAPSFTCAAAPSPSATATQSPRPTSLRPSNVGSFQLSRAGPVLSRHD